MNQFNIGTIYRSSKLNTSVDSRSVRFRFTEKQLTSLKEEFNKQTKIDKIQRLKISENLNIPEKQVVDLFSELILFLT